MILSQKIDKVLVKLRTQNYVTGGPRGLTLIELLIVLVILVGVSSVITVSLSDGVSVRGIDGENKDASEVVTEATMRTIRDALIGTPTSLGYLQDMGDFPSKLDALIENIDGENDYSPSLKRGWRGPYVVDNALRYDTSDPFPIGLGFDLAVGNGLSGFSDGDILILDGWGNPLVLGHDAATDDYWLISAGANRNLETDTTNSVDVNRGDDIIHFLSSSDPNL